MVLGPTQLPIGRGAFLLSREGEKDRWWTAGTARGGTGPHAHRTTARQATDGLWTEARGRQKQANDPRNNQHILNTPTVGCR